MVDNLPPPPTHTQRNFNEEINHNFLEVSATRTVDICPGISVLELLTWVSGVLGSIPCPASCFQCTCLFIPPSFPFTFVAVTIPETNRLVEHETLNLGVVGSCPALLADVIENSFFYKSAKWTEKHFYLYAI